MGRKLAFSREEALQAAMENFWTHGYDKTSMRKLAGDLKLHLGSVYNALGDKDRIFEACLQLHMTQCIMPRLQRMRDDADPWAAVIEIVDENIRPPANDSTARGCFIVNSLLDIAQVSDAVSAALADYFHEKHAALADCLSAAQKQGRLTATRNPSDDASFLIGTIFGLRALKKINAPEQHIRVLRDQAIAAIQK